MVDQSDWEMSHVRARRDVGIESIFGQVEKERQVHPRQPFYEYRSHGGKCLSLILVVDAERCHVPGGENAGATHVRERACCPGMFDRRRKNPSHRVGWSFTCCDRGVFDTMRTDKPSILGFLETPMWFGNRGYIAECSQELGE